MAIWQWDIWIIPRAEVLRHLRIIPTYIDQDWVESIEWWTTVAELELVLFFESLLPSYNTPWAKNTRSWGTDDGDRIELRVDEGMITEVAIRIDLRDLNLDFLSSIVDFSIGSDFLFYSLETNKLIEPDVGRLVDEIRKSRKALFLRDPDRFFDDSAYLDKIDKENRRKLNEDL